MALHPEINYILYTENSWHKDAEVNEISYIKLEKMNEKYTESRLWELCHYLQIKNELPAIPPQSSFQPELDNQSK